MRGAYSNQNPSRAPHGHQSYPTCCPLVRFSHIGSIKDAARDGPCAHGNHQRCLKSCYKCIFDLPDVATHFHMGSSRAARFAAAGQTRQRLAIFDITPQGCIFTLNQYFPGSWNWISGLRGSSSLRFNNKAWGPRAKLKLDPGTLSSNSKTKYETT